MNSNTGKLGKTGLLVESGQGVWPPGVSTAGTITRQNLTPTGGEVIIATAQTFTVKDMGWAVYIPANNELRIITAVLADDTFEVYPAFATAPAADSFELVRADGTMAREIGIANNGGATAIVGTALTAPQSLPDGIAVNFKADGGVTPVCWDASGTTLTVTILQ